MRKRRSMSRTHRAILAGILSAAAALAMATPKEQKAIVQTGNGGPEVLQLQTVPVLEPGPDQVLIKVYAAAVNPIDWKRREGMGRPAPAGAAAAPTSFIPGFDVAGVIEKTGSAVTQFKAGDAVFSMLGRVMVTGLNGGYSEYAIAPASNVIAKPKTLTYEQAAGLATTGMTGARTVLSAKVGKGQRVFIDGIAGGVGSAAAQIAKAQGAYVIGTASAKHHAYLKSIGVDEAIDYTQVKFEDAVKQPVDVVIETVGAETATRALKILKKGGILFSVAGSPSAEQCAAAGVNCAGPRGAEGLSEGGLLAQVAELAAAGKFKVNVDASFPLEQAAAAQEENRNGGTQGKIIIDVVAMEAKKK
jgi:NADPH:quinone reductase-like Zn-dependent oxidoreductase